MEILAQRQHTFVETDSVRYVFHPLDNVYMVLITTKASNILEDLETLRLFSRVVIITVANINSLKQKLLYSESLLFFIIIYLFLFIFYLFFL